MNIFDFLFTASNSFMFIYIYDDATNYVREIPAACYGGLTEIPVFIANKDVKAFRIDFKAESIHIFC